MFKPAWFLDHVEIEEPDKKDKYVFHCERWLAKNKEDGKIERTLYVKVNLESLHILYYAQNKWENNKT